MSIIIVHGIHTHGGGIDRFGGVLKSMGFDVRFFEYPKRWAISMYRPCVMRNDGAALASFMNDGDDIIAHSNGALIWQNSILANAKWNRCFIFGGACTSNKFYYPDESLKKAWIIYNPCDKALKWGARLPFHPFGKLGYTGYTGQPKRQGKDYRFKNINGFSNIRANLNHSHYWAGEHSQKWLKFITAKLVKNSDEND